VTYAWGEAENEDEVVVERVMEERDQAGGDRDGETPYFKAQLCGEERKLGECEWSCRGSHCALLS